jgi:hypothetical protein
MKIFSIIFLFTTIYYYFNSNRLKLKPKDRIYRNIFLVYFDLLFYLIELFYILWSISLLFINLKFGFLFISLMILRWFFLKPDVYRLDLIFIILKLICLILFFIS